MRLSERVESERRRRLAGDLQQPGTPVESPPDLPGRRNGSVVCVQGDGGLQATVGALQTIAHHRLPLKLFVFNNKGYLGIKRSQSSDFEGRKVGTDPKSGFSCPSAVKLGEAHGLTTDFIGNHQALREVIRKTLKQSGPVVVEVMLDPMQPIAPQVVRRLSENGTQLYSPLEVMTPPLPRETLQKEMIVSLVDE